MMIGKIGCVSATLVGIALSATAQSIQFERISNDRLLVPSPVDEKIEVVDGDTLWIGIHQIRLYGIDALESKQGCEITGESRTYCASGASEFLRTFTENKDFRCEIYVRDGENKPWVRYGRYVASCYVGDMDVNMQIVRNGWAYADRYHGKLFVEAEQTARREGKGIFATKHQTPWDWRKSQRDDGCTCE